MKSVQIIFSIFVFIIFLLGLYVYSSGKLDNLFKENREGMANNDTNDSNSNNMGANCPDLLIRQGNDILLYNSRIPVVKGMNPLVFFQFRRIYTFL